MLPDAGICNLALKRIGISQRINNLQTDQTVEAAVCRDVYAHTRDWLQENFNWPFAKKYESLAQVAEEPNDDWAYSYRYPPDCKRVTRVVAGVGPIEADPIPFALGSDASGLLIFTDYDPTTIMYVRKVDDESLFSSAFDSVFAWKIAMEIAMPLAVREALALKAENNYKLEIGKAQANELNQEFLGDQPDAGSVRARG
jgi:hypothetical protein